MLTLVTLLAGCSNNASTEAPQDIVADTNSSQKEMTSENENSAENKTQNDKNNVLIAYFSRIGNIDSENEVDAVSSASVVTQGNDLLGNTEYMATHIENLEEYDTIFLGFPNWYGDMPMAVYSFLDEYDLAGKKIYLFNSSGGGGVRNAYSEVSDLDPDAEVEKNIFSVSHSQVSQLTNRDM